MVTTVSGLVTEQQPQKEVSTRCWAPSIVCKPPQPASQAMLWQKVGRSRQQWRLRGSGAGASCLWRKQLGSARTDGAAGLPDGRGCFPRAPAALCTSARQGGATGTAPARLHYQAQSSADKLCTDCKHKLHDAAGSLDPAACKVQPRPQRRCLRKGWQGPDCSSRLQRQPSEDQLSNNRTARQGGLAPHQNASIRCVRAQRHSLSRAGRRRTSRGGSLAGRRRRSRHVRPQRLWPARPTAARLASRIRPAACSAHLLLNMRRLWRPRCTPSARHTRLSRPRGCSLCQRPLLPMAMLTHRKRCCRHPALRPAAWAAISPSQVQVR